MSDIVIVPAFSASVSVDANPAADALHLLWKEIILDRKPEYGEWEYPGQAYRHIKAEFDELRNELQRSRDNYASAVKHYGDLVNKHMNSTAKLTEIYTESQTHRWLLCSALLAIRDLANDGRFDQILSTVTQALDKYHEDPTRNPQQS